MIHAHSEPERYLTRFTNGEHAACSDTANDEGGGNGGFRPHELLEAALATCINMTLRMAAQKHDIPLVSASVEVTLDRAAPEGPTFAYRVDFHGLLTDTQKAALLKTLEHCPVRMTLSKGLRFAAIND